MIHKTVQFEGQCYSGKYFWFHLVLGPYWDDQGAQDIR